MHTNRMYSIGVHLFVSYIIKIFFNARAWKLEISSYKYLLVYTPNKHEGRIPRPIILHKRV